MRKQTTAVRGSGTGAGRESRGGGARQCSEPELPAAAWPPRALTRVQQRAHSVIISSFAIPVLIFLDRGNILFPHSYIIGWYKYFFGKGNIFESTRKYFWRTGSIFPWYQFNITHQSKVINQTEMSQDWMQVASLRSTSERLNTVNHFFHFRVSIVSIKLHYSRKM